MQEGQNMQDRTMLGRKEAKQGERDMQRITAKETGIDTAYTG